MSLKAVVLTVFSLTIGFVFLDNVAPALEKSFSDETDVVSTKKCFYLRCKAVCYKS